MARDLQNRVLDLVEDALGATLEREVAPDWLMRPGAEQCGAMWSTVESIYAGLTGGLALPEVMPPRERRSIDAVLTDPEGVARIIEVDESQHFTPPRAATLDRYPTGVVTAFDKGEWRRRAVAAPKLPGGGFARPCPPLFPKPGGRHLQRAFRDSLADLLPGEHGWAPTLRIGDFEVKDWLHAPDATTRMGGLLRSKGLE